MVTKARPSVIYAPQALAQLYHGVDTLTSVLALTLGPIQRGIINERVRSEIEILSDASVIARRMIRLPERSSNMGAMMLRKTLLELYENVGDGSATTAVMVKAMLQTAMRMVTAGIHPARMIRGIEKAVRAVDQALVEQAQPLTNVEDIAALASGVTEDKELSEILAQMFDILGENAAIMTQESPTPVIDHEYVKGGKWDGYIPSPSLVPESEQGLVLHNPLIFMTDEHLKTVDQVQPVLEQALAIPGKRPLLIAAREISNVALTTLVTNHVRGVLTIGVLVLSSGFSLIHEDITDMAVLTGGQAASALTGTASQHMRPDFFGQAERALLTRKGVIITGGKGDKQAIKERTHEVKLRLKEVSRVEKSDWRRLRIRLARLAGGIGVLKIGAYTEKERARKLEQVHKALLVLEKAYEEGAVAGGGAALLACIPRLKEVQETCQSEEERYGVTIVESALTAPFLQLVQNAGKVHPPVALDRVQSLGPGYGYDALTNEYVHMTEKRILDSVSVTRAALHAATSVATMMMTTDTIVLS